MLSSTKDMILNTDSLVQLVRATRHAYIWRLLAATQCSPSQHLASQHFKLRHMSNYLCRVARYWTTGSPRDVTEADHGQQHDQPASTLAGHLSAASHSQSPTRHETGPVTRQTTSNKKIIKRLRKGLRGIFERSLAREQKRSRRHFSDQFRRKAISNCSIHRMIVHIKAHKSYDGASDLHRELSQMHVQRRYPAHRQLAAIIERSLGCAMQVACLIPQQSRRQGHRKACASKRLAERNTAKRV